MPIAIPRNQPKTAAQFALIEQCGFRFCNKDLRYESKRKLTEVQLKTLHENGMTPIQYGKVRK